MWVTKWVYCTWNQHSVWETGLVGMVFGTEFGGGRTTTSMLGGVTRGTGKRREEKLNEDGGKGNLQGDQMKKGTWGTNKEILIMTMEITRYSKEGR